MKISTEGPRLVLDGDFDVRCTREVRAAIYDLLEAQGDIVIDMTRVEGIDVTALRVLAVATRSARRSDHHLTLRGCRPAVRRLLHLSHLSRRVEVEHAAATV